MSGCIRWVRSLTGHRVSAPGKRVVRISPVGHDRGSEHRRRVHCQRSVRVARRRRGLRNELTNDAKIRSEAVEHGRGGNAARQGAGSVFTDLLGERPFSDPGCAERWRRLTETTSRLRSVPDQPVTPGTATRVMPRRSSTMATYSSDLSASTARRPVARATAPVVPDPHIGSSTNSPSTVAMRTSGS